MHHVLHFFASEFQWPDAPSCSSSYVCRCTCVRWPTNRVTACLLLLSSSANSLITGSNTMRILKWGHPRDFVRGGGTRAREPLVLKLQSIQPIYFYPRKIASKIAFIQIGLGHGIITATAAALSEKVRIPPASVDCCLLTFFVAVSECTASAAVTAARVIFFRQRMVHRRPR